MVLKLKYVKEYLSINDKNFPKEFTFDSDFIILTGENGSGKTHLLKAIEGLDLNPSRFPSSKIYPRTNYIDIYNGTRKISHDRIKYFNYTDFSVKTNQIENENKQMIMTKTRTIIDNLKKEIGNEKIDYESIIVKNLIENNKDYEIIINYCKEYDSKLEGIDLERIWFEFIDIDAIITLESFIKEYINNILKSHVYDTSQLGNTKQITRLNNAPWKKINEHIDKLLGNNFKYRIYEPTKGDNPDKYILKLYDKFNILEISNFSKLSSGEQILFALIATIYIMKQNGSRLELLLLDEIDATLHPKMICLLLEQLKELNVKIIFATHSPSTVVLAPDNAKIYCMYSKDNSSERIKEVDRQEAIDVLSEGFININNEKMILDLDTLLSQDKPILIVEGWDDYQILKKSYKILYNQSIPYHIIPLFGCGTIKSYINDKDNFSERVNASKIIGIFDNDYKGNKSFNLTNERTSEGIHKIRHKCQSVNDSDSNGFEVESYFYYIPELSSYFNKHKPISKTKILSFIIKSQNKSHFDKIKELFEEIENKLK